MSILNDFVGLTERDVVAKMKEDGWVVEKVVLYGRSCRTEVGLVVMNRVESDGLKTKHIHVKSNKVTNVEDFF